MKQENEKKPKKEVSLFAAVLLCSLVSLACGTSNGTAGTAGVALIGIGNSMGIPSPITAGAIICGSYFGGECQKSCVFGSPCFPG